MDVVSPLQTTSISVLTRQVTYYVCPCKTGPPLLIAQEIVSAVLVAMTSVKIQDSASRWRINVPRMLGRHPLPWDLQPQSQQLWRVVTTIHLPPSNFHKVEGPVVGCFE